MAIPSTPNHIALALSADSSPPSSLPASPPLVRRQQTAPPPPCARPHALTGAAAQALHDSGRAVGITTADRTSWCNPPATSSRPMTAAAGAGSWLSNLPGKLSCVKLRQAAGCGSWDGVQQPPAGLLSQTRQQLCPKRQVPCPPCPCPLQCPLLRTRHMPAPLPHSTGPSLPSTPPHRPQHSRPSLPELRQLSALAYPSFSCPSLLSLAFCRVSGSPLLPPAPAHWPLPSLLLLLLPLPQMSLT